MLNRNRCETTNPKLGRQLGDFGTTKRHVRSLKKRLEAPKMLATCPNNAEDKHDASNGKRLAAGVVTGAAFGFLLDKGKMNVPLAIVDQMGMTNFSMMRFFLSASASSILCMSALESLGIKARKAPGGVDLGTGLKGPLSGYGANLLGGALLGSGMAITGSCPGTVWTQIGAGMPYTGSIVAGGVTGTLLYGYVHSYLKRRNAEFAKVSGGKTTLDKAIGLPYPVVGLAMAGGFMGIVKLFDTYFPWREGLAKLLALGIEPRGDFLPDVAAIAWDPMVCGSLLGLLQIPASLTNGKGLGSSSGWVTMAGAVSHAIDPQCDKKAPYFKDARSIWQIGGAVGMVLGAWLSNYLSGSGPEIYSAIGAQGAGSHLNAFAGGIVLLFGARLAGGCPSGHGLTGMGTLAFSSFITVAGMFIGGMGVRLLPKVLGF